jgi:hypothetical protein
MRGVGHKQRWTAVALFLGLLAPVPAQAGPYFGDWSYCWHPAKDCPKGDYCFLHYWTPLYYRVRAYCHPVNVSSAPPGLPIPYGFQVFPYPCRTKLPAPTLPYSDPAGYFERELIPPPGAESVNSRYATTSTTSSPAQPEASKAAAPDKKP